MAKEQSRPERWAAACANLRAAYDELVVVRDEYQEWLDNMPENAQSGPTHEKLEAISELDIDGLDSLIEECETVDLPKGFGRD